MPSEAAKQDTLLARLGRFGLPKRGKSKDDQLSAAIARVLFPVMICMALSIYLTHSVGDTQRRCGPPVRDGRDIIVPQSVSGGDSPAVSLRKTTIIFISIFVGCTVVITFVLLLLYRYRCEKFIFGWLFLAVFLVFCYVGGLYLFSWSRSRCLSLDWITLAFVVWNFAVCGLVAIFWKAPRVVNQAYLILVSALMAYIFRHLPDWGTWIILVLLVAWDLFAVLAPCGPLKLLVELARERDDPIPALVYDTNPGAVGRDPTAQFAVNIPRSNGDGNGNDDENAAESTATNKKRRRRKNQEGENNVDTEAQRLVEAERGEARTQEAGQREDQTGGARRRGKRKRGEGQNDTQGGRNGTRSRNDDEEEVKIGTLGVHLKLGLGDFVFYSVLVAQASQAGATTAVVSFVAILFGLCATLLLVTIFRRALPALPISIVLGLSFYYLTRYTIQPFVENILPELLLH